MAIKSYATQAELLLRNYMHADSYALCTSIIGSICACKMVYDLSQVISAAYLKSYSRLSKLKKIEWNNRAISTFHAIFITTMSLYFVFWSDLYSDDRFAPAITLRHSKLSTFPLGVSIGYFLSDLGMIIWLYPSLGGLEYVAHHLLSMLSVIYAMVTGEGQIYTYMVLISEATTPSINLRWYLDAAGMKTSRAYLINGVVMFLAWVVARMLLFLYLFYHIWVHYDKVMQMQTFGHCLVLGVPSVLIVLNSVWFWKILMGLKKTLAKRH
ncbi:uncharacterized protein [Coffea arabica]|uniref:Transmembrane protein 56-B-like n=1 Tax=Coffea arabica TaxID=13443 RepID=A0A6P6SBR7_COFAR|nr:transmembrane protein 56-B-like [Coffea arabica]XP_027063256.1 transmembrane protein 56-B-like [Coffea arabica]